MRSRYIRLLRNAVEESGSWPATANNVDGAPGRRGGWHPEDEYDYRTVLPTEMVFDIGDHGDWGRCRKDTITLWGRLVRQGYRPGVDFWPALSAGKGTHTHVFVARPEYRLPFARWITQPRFPGDTRVIYDVCTITPSARGQLVREFGGTHPRTEWRKALWTHDYTALPDTREKAYDMQSHPSFPTQRSNVGLPRGAFPVEVKEMFGGRCPRSPECLDSEWGDPCLRCPSMM